MHYRISFIFITFICLFSFATTGIAQNANTDEDSKPVILYSGTPKKYEIADIKVEGVKNYEDYVLIGLSGLSVGQTITVPGDEITGAIKRYWRHGLFSNVQITAEKIEGNKIWLKISLTQRPRISEVRYHGVKKSERTDLEGKLGMVKGMQITPNTVDRAKTLIKRYFDDKGFKNAEVIIAQKDDRTDDLIKSSGYRIGPFEIESVLMEHPAVLECAITGVPDPVRGQIVKATIVLTTKYSPSDELAKEIQDYVKKSTAPYKYPRIIEFVTELPKTISGKIRRVEIREKDSIK